MTGLTALVEAVAAPKLTPNQLLGLYLGLDLDDEVHVVSDSIGLHSAASAVTAVDLSSVSRATTR
jgi:hypothetical protein